MRTYVSATILLAIAVSSVHADDWPQWLGPKRDGVWRETGLLAKFPQGGPNVRWRTPISEGFMPSGSVNVSGSTGTANLSISISGPKGSGTITVEARRSGGNWTYQLLQVQIAGTGKIIDLRRE